MKRKFTFLLMALLALAGFKSWGQTTILSEGFEHDGSFPEGWTATHNNANGTGWYLAGTDDNISSGYSGWSAFCKGYSSQGIEDYLTTYAIDFSGYMSASLSFYYTNRQWYSDINQIRVEYSSSTDGSWTTLWSNTTGTGTGYGNWIQANNINLSALCGGTYYLRFVNVDKYGYGIAIDEILITGIAGGTSYNITYDNTIQHGSISGPATAFANQTVTLTATPAENYALDHFTVDGLAIQGKTFTMPEHDVMVSATFKQVFTLTVNDGTTIDNNYVPFYGYYANYYPTKSEFVIPAGVLETMEGGIISGLTFYTSDYTNNHDFQGASWDIYLKEADYTMPGGVDGYTYTNLASMTKVYSGSLSVTNHQVTIVFDNPFVYNSQNLVISFQQTSLSTLSSNVQWIGKTEGTEMRSRGGYYKDFTFPSGSPSSYASRPFLPKTTFTYIPGETYTVTVIQPATGGGIDANPKTDVTSGTTVTLSATPETGYDLSEWIVTNVTTSQPITVTNNQFTMPDSDVTVSATFAQLTQHNVNISQSIEHGTVTASPSACYKGETVTLTFEPASGYANPNYNDIIVTDASSGSVDVQYDSGNYYFIMPNSDVMVFATFNRLYNISLGSYEHGEVSTYPADNAVYGASVNISVKPDAGYQISSITVDYEGGQITPDYWGLYGEYHTYNFTMPAYNVTVNVSITEIPHYNVSIGDIANGTVAIVGETSYMAGETVSLNVQPAAGYELESITATPETGDPITPSFDGNYYTFTMPASNVTVTATFISALTVYNGITTNQYTAVYTFYADVYGSAAQFVVPAEQLTAMEGGEISSIKFYVDPNNISNLQNLGGPSYAGYITEVTETTMSNFIDFGSATTIFTGHVSLSNNNSELVIDFSTPYTYDGGNLAIAFVCTASSGWTTLNYYGTTVTGGGIYRNNGTGATINNFIPKTTFYYTPGATRYNITCDNAITGGTISADQTKAAAGTTVKLTPVSDYGYKFGAWVEDYEDVTIENNQFTMPEHDVTISATFNALPKYAINSAVVTGGTVHAEYDNVTITEAPEGTVITLVAEAATDYIFEYFTVDGVQIEGNTYTMGTSAIEIGASFRQLKSYAITYYVNGSVQKTLHPKENAFISIVEPSSTVIPAGTTFAGWSREDITTYQTTEPVFVGNTEHPTEDCSLYAVLSYSEMGGATAWTKVTDFSELNDNDVVIIGAVQNGNSGYTLNEISEMSSNATCPALPATFSNDGTTITELPEGTTHFTITKYPYNYGGIYLQGESGKNLLSFWTYNLNIPAGWEETVGDEYNDIITFDNGKLIISYNDGLDELYVILRNIDQYGGINMRFGVEQIQPGYYDAAYLYKQQGALATYYMTEVFVIDEATSLTEDMTKRNVIIADGASLNINANVTLNVAGACFNPSHDAAQLVVAEGGQLIHNNAGVLATMKKHINGIEWYTISSPLAASVNVTDVTNLIPNSVTDTNYDLYRFDEKNGVWVNSRLETGANPDFTTIDKGVGYIYSNTTAADVAFAGEINVADVECNLTNGAAHGFNLIGNPFSQNIKLTDVKSDGTAVLADGFYVLNNDETWGTKLTESEIKPLQGFLVQATTAGDVTISKPTSSSKGERSNEQSTNIEMIVSNASFKDNAYAMFGEGIGLNKVSHRNAEAPMLYVPQDGEDFAIAFMDENTTVFPLSFKAMTTGSYSISLKPTDDVSTLVLVDNMTGEETNMLLEDSYTFIGSPADNESRFTVKLRISDNGQDEDEHFAYQNGSELVINGEGTLQIFDVLGRVVISEEVHGQTVNVGGLNTGAYIVRLTGESVKTQKIVVR